MFLTLPLALLIHAMNSLLMHAVAEQSKVLMKNIFLWNMCMH